MRAFSNRSAELWALLSRTDAPSAGLAIFIHGFRGNYLTTWGELPELLAQHSDAQPPFDAWDYLFLGYDTRDVKSYLDIAARIAGDWSSASQGRVPYTHQYSRLALFGHSLGTLGIRQLLCAWSAQPAGMLAAIRSVTLFGTPLNGSPLARFAFGYDIADALKPKNPQLRMLKTWCTSAYGKDPWPNVRVVLGQDDAVVGQEFVELIQWDGDSAAQQLPLDHSSLVKPGSWNCSLVDNLKIGLA
jgi:hypothetical protein